MEVITKIIEYSRPDKFPFYPLGDIHSGPVHCDEELLKEKVKEIRSNPDALWLGMGDYADLITPHDFKRWDGAILAPWMKGKENNIGPTQLERLDEILSPIWGQCIGLIEGGHETSICKYHHYDMMEELLKRANGKKEPPWDKVPYAGVQCMIRLNFRRGTETHDYIVHARHGEGAARTSGARALAVLRLAMTFVNANITLMGHLHGQESPDIPERLVLKGGRLKNFETIATMTGAWLRAYMQGVPPCYLERWGSTPSTLGCPRIVIDPDNHEMTLEKSRKTMTL